jgi:hypothetical protein
MRVPQSVTLQLTTDDALLELDAMLTADVVDAEDVARIIVSSDVFELRAELAFFELFELSAK